MEVPEKVIFPLLLASVTTPAVLLLVLTFVLAGTVRVDSLTPWPVKETPSNVPLPLIAVEPAPEIVCTAAKVFEKMKRLKMATVTNGKNFFTYTSGRASWLTFLIVPSPVKPCQ